MGAFDRLAEEFAGVANFYVVYTHEAHPDPETWPDSETTDDRRQRAACLAEEHPLGVRVLVDPVESSLAEHFWIADTGIVMIDSSGAVLLKSSGPSYQDTIDLRVILDARRQAAETQ